MPEQFENREAIRRHQLDALRALLRAILPANAFYARKLQDFSPEIAGLEELNAPFTTKQELVDDQAARPPYGTNLTFPVERYTRFHQTSGTTSAPLRWLDTQESWEWMLGNWHRIFREGGLEPGGPVTRRDAARGCPNRGPQHVVS